MKFLELLSQQAWHLYIAGFFCLAFFFTYFFSVFYKRFKQRLYNHERYVLYIILEAIYKPFLVCLWLQFCFRIMNLFESEFNLHPTVLAVVHASHTGSLVLTLYWALLRFIRLFEKQLSAGHLTKQQPDEISVQATSKLLRIVAVVIVILLVIPHQNITGILLALGGGSFLLVQPILTNYFGGIFIYSDRLFKPGDWVYSPDRDIEGIVEYIGWRVTCIRTFDKRPLYVPNSIFSSVSIINASRMTHRRIRQTLGIRYQDVKSLGTITQEITHMLRNHPDLDTNQNLLASFTDIGPHTLNIDIYAFTKTVSWAAYRAVQQEVFIKAIEIIEKNNAKLAVPMRSLEHQTTAQSNPFLH